MCNKKVAVSACLLGVNCKYNGGNNYNQKLVDYLHDKEVIAICPEVEAGYPSPRPKAELLNNVMYDELGNNIDHDYRLGVAKVLEKLKHHDIDYCILQSRSPTCGLNQIYDGTFTKKLIKGHGILAQALLNSGYKVIDIADFKGTIS